MKKYHSLSFVCMAVGTLLWMLISTGCVKENEVESLFDQSATQRARVQANELRGLLQAAEHGWKLSYQPDKQTGVYHFLFRFVPDTSIVRTQSDFSLADLSPSVSEYEITQGSATKLVFTTRGPIHKLSDPEFSPIPNAGGSGLKGSYEFLYQSTADNGKDLIFITERRRDTVIFKQAAPQYADTLALHLASLDILRHAFDTQRLFPFAIILNAAEEYSPESIISASRVSVNFYSRSFSLTRISEDQEGRTIYHPPYTSGFGLSPTGIRLVRLDLKEEEEDDKEHKDEHQIKHIDLTWNPASREYHALLEGGRSVTLGYHPADFAHQNFVDYINSLRGVRYLLFDLRSSSPDIAQKLNELAASYGEYLRRVTSQSAASFIQIYPALYVSKQFDIRAFAIVENSPFEGLRLEVYYPLRFKVEGKRLVMQLQNGEFERSFENLQLQSQINDMVALLSDPMGFYVSEQMSVPIPKRQGQNNEPVQWPGYKLISVRNPNNQLFITK